MNAEFDPILAELGDVLSRVKRSALASAVQLIAHAGTIVTYGCGREGLMMRGLAMRLHHLGLTVGVQGEMTCPPLGAGDLFFCSAGPGELSTVSALMQVASRAGAKVLVITAEPDSPSFATADHILTIPAQTMARDQEAPTSILPMGSVFEGAMFLLFEKLVLDVQSALSIDQAAMRARHTNLE